MEPSQAEKSCMQRCGVHLVELLSRHRCMQPLTKHYTLIWSGRGEHHGDPHPVPKQALKWGKESGLDCCHSSSMSESFYTDVKEPYTFTANNTQMSSVAAAMTRQWWCSFSSKGSSCQVGCQQTVVTDVRATPACLSTVFIPRDTTVAPPGSWA